MVGKAFARALWICCFAIPCAEVLAAVTIPDPGTFVVDRANVIDAGTRAKLESWLRELEQKTGAQVKVLTVQSTEDEPIFNFSMRHAELWKLGKKGKDNGALLVVAIQDRKYRLQVGYGLEPTLTDSWTGSLQREMLVPAFRQGDYTGGLYKTVVTIANKVAEDANVTLTGMPKMHLQQQGPAGGIGAGFLVLLIVLMVLLSISRRRGYYGGWGGGGFWSGMFWGSVLRDMSRGSRGGWGSGSSSGWGGSGGGFGGSFGGGGGFGGGGSGGGW
ncbi:MAG: TPM domain-containing protein [Planctomycetes bacterium]|nr:TPM domain-containing protein [Planctomycetota bacterium]MBI3835062.1 TPM domain-containing protein [Planctomycetota bacterium]